jgi:hypothetical protein
MKEIKIRKNEVGTYLEDLINTYNIKIITGKTTYEELKSIEKEISERRKLNK